MDSENSVAVQEAEGRAEHEAPTSTSAVLPNNRVMTAAEMQKLKAKTLQGQKVRVIPDLHPYPNAKKA